MICVQKPTRSQLRFLPYPLYQLLYRSERGCLPELNTKNISVDHIFRPACFIPAFHAQILPKSHNEIASLQYHGLSYVYCDRSAWNFTASDQDHFFNADPYDNGLRFLLIQEQADNLLRQQAGRFVDNVAPNIDDEDDSEQLEYGAIDDIDDVL